MSYTVLAEPNLLGNSGWLEQAHAPVPSGCTAARFCLQALTFAQRCRRGESELASLLDDAGRSARMCASEGRSGLSAVPILVCKRCGHSANTDCAEKPEHDYVEYTRGRVAPLQFRQRLLSALPTVIALPLNVELVGTATPAGVEPTLFAAWLAQVRRTCSCVVRSVSLWMAQSAE